MSGKLRAITAALLLCAGGLAVALSVSPQLHDWLHKAADRSNHECAATILSSGNVDHAGCEPVPTCPEAPPSTHTFRTQPFPRVLALLGSSRLEHAPPARS